MTMAAGFRAAAPIACGSSDLAVQPSSWPAAAPLGRKALAARFAQVQLLNEETP
jgi:hypothetical protein